MKNIYHLLCCLILLLCVSCSKKNEPKDKDVFYMLDGSVPEGAQIFVNGNPTNQGELVSLFLIEGDNEITIKSDFKTEGYSIRLVETKNLFSNDFKTPIKEEKTAEQARKSSTHALKIDHWWRWVWQDCDTLGTITAADKKEILRIFDSLCTNIQDFDGNPDLLLWSDHKHFIERLQELKTKIKAGLPPQDQMIETKADHAEIKFISGKQMVMIVPTQSDHLYFKGLDPKKEAQKPTQNDGKWTFHYQLDQVFFVKKDGKWKGLLPVN